MIELFYVLNFFFPFAICYEFLDLDVLGFCDGVGNDRKYLGFW